VDFPTRFDFAAREREIYDLWLREDAFVANADSSREPYVICIPPPNVTGALHLGHALNNTLQDILIRWKRMDGYEALYLPGTDHAGIATQFKVEQQLIAQGQDRWKLGRAEFLKRVWTWKEEYGGQILRQLQRLGCSCDWSRTRFTMDEGYSRAVRTAFLLLYKKGYITRGRYVVNWCPGPCQTVLSDLETVKKKSAGKLWHIRYPLKGLPGKFVVVATTRPETMLGDTAVAVHPQDERYAGLVGKSVVLPLMEREIPIVADPFVDRSFGSGAVKVTPAHDVNDFECAQRLKLPAVAIFDARGVLNENAGRFKGLDRFDARKQVVEALAAAGLLEKEEDYEVPLTHCYRCGTILEPWLSDQWFVRMKELAAPVADAIRRGDVKFRPERWSKPALDWLENIRDWCISRQLWWGHQIPVWYCTCGLTLAALEAPARCPACGGERLRQDEDVLDTWFSSALWPFATLGWPEMTEDFERFYPGHALVTDRGIINLWVARMVTTGLEFCGEKPFADVVIHATLMDDAHKRQSKSLGTGIDPLELMDEYGADALRLALAWLCTGGQDFAFGQKRSAEHLERCRRFVTKLWNAARFAVAGGARPGPLPATLGPEERWILGAAAQTARTVERALEQFEFGEAAQSLYHFTWGDLCDWYIELAKARLQEPVVGAVLADVLARVLKLLHPIMPFVTEDLWQRLREAGWELEPLLAKAQWPSVEERRIDGALDERMRTAFEVVRRVREIRNEHKEIKRDDPLDAIVVPRAQNHLTESADLIRRMAVLSSLTIDTAAAAPAGSAVAVTSAFKLYVPLAGRIDLAAEAGRLGRKKKETEGYVESLRKKLGAPGFRENAPREIVEADEARLTEARQRLEEIEESLRSIGHA
jgi:valyl-tRNA synthetase